MGTTDRRMMLERLYDLEKTIVQLNQRVGQLQRKVDHGRIWQKDEPRKGSCLRSLFGVWRQAGTAVAAIRENRRVERHATSLF